jgi:phosphatidylglycerophosphate synthase
VKLSKQLADVLTCCRPVLAVCIAWLGVAAGQEALPSVVLITITTWVSDVFDGYLARRDPTAPHTWIGEHDAEADLSVSLGVLAYLVLSGYLPAVSILLGVVTVAIWALASHQLAWPLYAMPYLALIWVAFGAAPALSWIALGYLAVVTSITWPRLPQQYLPQFFRAAARLAPTQWARRKNG